ncbi:MAG: valine--tRNA ligase [Actinobacteria bacterium]|nr:valine--tRNA ligase [Actinomycetota bacterium]
MTGSLHIGHALVASVEDAIIRHARQSGCNAVWLPGTDHAGIATQNVVERLLADEGLTRHDLGRERFLERVWVFVEEAGGIIQHQHRRLGTALDWDREIFTFDEQRSKAVREVFCRWYEQGLIYRGHRLINWCPRCLTALSDIEVDHVDEDGELAELRYPGSDGSDGVVVATTRAETMLGDTAVAVHPDDERYRHLVGTTVVLPLVNRAIPVVADDHVDPEFGSGAVKVTPAHDPNDWEISQRHDLPAINIFTDDAHVNEAGGPYEGLDRFEARRRVKADLDAQGLLVGVAPRTHPVGHCSRCKTIVEPRLSDQWFVHMTPLAEPAIAAVRDGRTRFIPERNAKTFVAWLENLHDWCISRQLWWGHQIPAWYDRDGTIHVRRTDPTPEEVAELGLERDPDVLDTWFSSQLFPFVNLGWDGDTTSTPELDTWYPTAVLETGYDINTFWVSRMLMAGLSMMGEVPFRVVYNHGMVRDGEGKKMSKSFGNVIDPLEFIDRYGADALRFALLRASTAGQDAPLAEEWVEGARRFANKLWNAARFVLLVAGDTADTDGFDDPLPPDGLALEDRWILSRLEDVRAEVDQAMQDWDLGRVARALFHFTWDEYCDWYLELAKLRTGADAATDDAAAARWTLRHVLDRSMRLLHPLMPFITEEIWRTLDAAADDTTIQRSPWPAPMAERRDPVAESRFAAVTEAVTELRRFRSDHALAPSRRIAVLARAQPGHRSVLEVAVPGIRRLAGVDDWSFVDDVDHVEGPLGRVPVTGADLYVPLAGLIDLDEERARLQRELERATSELARARSKLSNEGFVTRAPADVVQAERDKASDWDAAVARIDAQLATLARE